MPRARSDYKEIISSQFFSALIRKARRERAKQNFWYFVETYLSRYLQNKTPDFHKEIIDLVLKEKRVAVAAPRGFSKSTLVCFFYALYCLLFNKNNDILLVSKSAAMAEEWIMKIKAELDNNEKIKRDFGLLLKWGDGVSMKWTNEHISIHCNSPNDEIFSQIRAKGRGCQVRGLRPTTIIVDDIEDDEEIRSSEQRTILRNWFLYALLNTIKTDQQIVVIGTILHPHSLLAEIMQKVDVFENWTTKKYRAIENNCSIWEDRFPLTALMQRKQEIGSYAFETEFQNNPINTGVCLWREEWIKTYSSLPKIVRKFAALDPAISVKQSADYSAMVCIGEGEDGNFYELETIGGRWGTWELVDNFFIFYQKHKPVKFGIEDVAFQGVLKDVLIEEARKKEIPLSVIEPIKLGAIMGKEKKQSKDKYTRALAVIHFFEQGRVFLKSQNLIEQLLLFPTGEHDDLVDALVYTLLLFKRFSPVKIMVKQEIKPVRCNDVNVPCFASFSHLTNSVNSWKIG